ASLDKWRTQGIYREIKPMDHLPGHYTCIVFDRREAGRSGGRVEHITWSHYAAQGRGLLQDLGFDRAHLLGGCMGCPPALALAVAHPEMVSSMVLFWPVGGARYRIRGQSRFGRHLAFVEEEGIEGVVDLAQRTGDGFGQDPRVGPWAPVLRHDERFVEEFRGLDQDRYQLIVSATGHSLHDRDTAPGAEPEDLLRLDMPALIIPGQDRSHPTSAARYLEECLNGSDYWDVPVSEQTEETVSPRILKFLDSVG
ncbi:MAG TPA: alpha/beta hydrolase, partial [Acidimicrobiia bacterium]|nr:alpha/beta hydrolase [Acidimicrobiia bacterium]